MKAYRDLTCANANASSNERCSLLTVARCTPVSHRKLIEHLSHPRAVDQHFMAAFLLTYRSFTTPSRLLRLLRARFDVPEPPCLTPSELSSFHADVVRPIRLRVINVLKHWLRG